MLLRLDMDMDLSLEPVSLLVLNLPVVPAQRQHFGGMLNAKNEQIMTNAGSTRVVAANVHVVVGAAAAAELAELLLVTVCPAFALSFVAMPRPLAIFAGIVRWAQAAGKKLARFMRAPLRIISCQNAFSAIY